MEILLLTLAMFLFSAIFSGSETAMFSLKPAQTESLKDRDDFLSRCLVALLNQKGATLIVILVGNLAVNTFLSSSVSELAVTAFGKQGLAWAVPLITILIIIFGEILPKTLALRTNLTWSLLVAPPMALLKKCIQPAAVGLQRFTDWLFDTLGPKSPQSSHMNADELATMISIGESQGIFNRWERKLVEQIFAFREVYAVERMTPRPDVLAISAESSREEVLQVIETSRRTKIPVYEEDIDSIIGYFQVRDFLLFPEKSIREILYPVLVIPEMKPMDRLLQEMQVKNIKLAILLDEYGSLQGILTLEDVLDTIFGDLDRDSSRRQMIRRKGAGKWLVSSQTPLRELDSSLECDVFEDAGEPGQNLASFVASELNKVAEVGDQVECEGYVLRVHKVLKRRILEIEVREPVPEEEEE